MARSLVKGLVDSIVRGLVRGDESLALFEQVAWGDATELTWGDGTTVEWSGQ
jgi:hypothetical protein